MKKKCNLLVMLVCLLALGLVFIGCPTDSGGGGGSTGTSSGGVKNRATITIKNQLNTSIRVTLEDAWDPKEEDAPKILSGLGTKTIGANAEGTWSLECSGGKARVNIETRNFF
jgi:hypothetical protein